MANFVSRPIFHMYALVVACIWPFINIYIYTGSPQKIIQGIVAYFETKLPELGGAFQYTWKMGLPQKLYVMLCGRFTPMQRNIIQKQFKFDSDLNLDILNYFINDSGHPGFKGMPSPEYFPCPVFIADQPNQNNTDHSINPRVDKVFTGGNHYLSTAQYPWKKT